MAVTLADLPVQFSNAMMSSMPLFDNLSLDMPERMLFDSIESPPESPYSASAMSDIDDFAELLSSAPSSPLSPVSSASSPEIMWGAHAADVFMASSVVAWVPDEPDELPTFDLEDAVEFVTTTANELAGLADLSSPPVAVAVPPASPAPAPVPAPARVAAPKVTKKYKVAEKSPHKPTNMKKTAATAAASPVAAAVRAVAAKDDSENKRHTHNVLERKRRNDLKTSYQQLRLQLPALVTNDRAPTGQILIHAVERIAQLKAEDASIQAKLARARAEHARLRQQLC